MERDKQFNFAIITPISRNSGENGHFFDDEFDESSCDDEDAFETESISSQASSLGIDMDEDKDLGPNLNSELQETFTNGAESEATARHTDAVAVDEQEG
jgi:hypothetical protein